MSGIGTLALAALVWIGVHIGIAGTTVRSALAARLGERGFRIAFSVASVAAIVFLVQSYNAAPTTLLWTAPEWLRWVLALVMLVAFVLFAASVTAPNPTAVGGERALGREPRGIGRITRHPMLWSFALWAAVHMLGNGDTASLLFFGAFGVTALAGMPSIDAKVAARDPEAWDRYVGAHLHPALRRHRRGPQPPGAGARSAGCRWRSASRSGWRCSSCTARSSAWRLWPVV